MLLTSAPLTPQGWSSSQFFGLPISMSTPFLVISPEERQSLRPSWSSRNTESHERNCKKETEQSIIIHGTHQPVVGLQRSGKPFSHALCHTCSNQAGG
jgi:hypothetical protein